MDRRNFLTALFCATGAAIAVASVPAEALTLLSPPAGAELESGVAAAVATETDLANAQVEDAYYYYVRRRRFRRRRLFYRPYYRFRRRRYCVLRRGYYGRLYRVCR